MRHESYHNSKNFLFDPCSCTLYPILSLVETLSLTSLCAPSVASYTQGQKCWCPFMALSSSLLIPKLYIKMDDAGKVQGSIQKRVLLGSFEQSSSSAVNQCSINVSSSFLLSLVLNLEATGPFLWIWETFQISSKNSPVLKGFYFLRVSLLWDDPDRQFILVITNATYYTVVTHEWSCDCGVASPGNRSQDYIVDACCLKAALCFCT